MIPQPNRGREESSSEFDRATESISDDEGMCLGRLSRDLLYVDDRESQFDS